MVARVGATVGTDVTCPMAVISGERDHEAEDGRHDRERHGGRGPEGEQQDHDRGRDPDRLAALGRRAARASGRRSRRPPGGGRPSRRGPRRPGSLRLGGGRFARPDVQRDGDVRDLAVLAEQRRAPWSSGLTTAGDVGHSLQVRDGRVDRLGAGRIAERPARVAQRERDAAVRLLRELLLQEVGRQGRAGAGELRLSFNCWPSEPAHSCRATAAITHAAMTPHRSRTLARPTE